MVRAKTYQRMYERAMLAESRCAELQDQLNDIALELSNLWQSFQRVTIERDAMLVTPPGGE